MLETYPCYIVSDFDILLGALDNLVSSGSENSSEKINYTNAVSFLKLLSDIGFCQLVKGPTHNQSGTLDL